MELIPIATVALVEVPEAAASILFAVALPMVFPSIVIEAAEPETLIPTTLPEMVAVVPVEVKAPSWLLFIDTVFVEEEWIPTTTPSEVDEVPRRDPVPLVAPITLFVMLALPLVRLIPQRMPLVVVAPLLVVRDILATVLLLMILFVPPAVNEPLIPINLKATVDVSIIVPVSATLANPITLFEIVYPEPEVTLIPLAVLAVVAVRVAVW